LNHAFLLELSLVNWAVEAPDGRRDGRPRAAATANSDTTASAFIARAKPALNASGSSAVPAWPNTSTANATPNTPPRKRSALKTPEARPSAAGATAPSAAACAAGIAAETPMPAAISAGTSAA
jgi:hypothetical protein